MKQILNAQVPAGIVNLLVKSGRMIFLSRQILTGNFIVMQ